jgi:hypothetical protein
MMFGKKVLFSVFGIFLGFQSWKLVSIILVYRSEANLTLPESLVYAFLINLFLTGVFAFPGFVFPTHRMLPKAYYDISNPSVLSGLFKALGVKYFRILLMIAFWGKKKNKKKFFDGTRNGIENLIYQSKQSEFGHLAPLVLISVISFSFVVQQHYLLAAMTIFINVVGNFYPILLQRHHRMRIQKINLR